MKANYIDIHDIFFLKRDKNCNVRYFSMYLVSCRVKARANIAQNGEAFASKLEDTSLAAIFFAFD